MGDSEYMKASQLLEMAAEQAACAKDEYCAKLRDPRAWGGGPEIVALSNALSRPIHIYEHVDGPRAQAQGLAPQDLAVHGVVRAVDRLPQARAQRVEEARAVARDLSGTQVAPRAAARRRLRGHVLLRLVVVQHRQHVSEEAVAVDERPASSQVDAAPALAAQRWRPAAAARGRAREQ